jgi:hypothetical protein
MTVLLSDLSFENKHFPIVMRTLDDDEDPEEMDARWVWTQENGLERWATYRLLARWPNYR